MSKEDEEKTTFHTYIWVFCYKKMPFGLQNGGAMYQRLIDKAFKEKIRRNVEAYVDNLVIKSHSKNKMIKDIEETFKNLIKIKTRSQEVLVRTRRRKVSRSHYSIGYQSKPG